MGGENFLIMKTRTKTRKITPPEPAGPSPSISDTSDTSDIILMDGSNPFAHLIDIGYLPNLDCRVYNCKEHPDAPGYYDLRGMIVSHFKPNHTEVQQ
jgi:hypothetical protein